MPTSNILLEKKGEHHSDHELMAMFELNSCEGRDRRISFLCCCFFHQYFDICYLRTAATADWVSVWSVEHRTYLFSSRLSLLSCHVEGKYEKWGVLAKSQCILYEYIIMLGTVYCVLFKKVYFTFFKSSLFSSHFRLHWKIHENGILIIFKIWIFLKDYTLDSNLDSPFSKELITLPSLPVKM